MQSEVAYSAVFKFSDPQTSSSLIKSERLDVWIEVKSSRITLAESGHSYLVMTFFDVTNQIMAQQTIALQQDELGKFNRLSALGEISAGIAHEINTPLNVITTKSDLLRTAAQRKKLDDTIAYRVSSDIDQMVKNISSIVQGLKSVAGLDPEKFERASLALIVRDTIKICEFRLHRFGIDIKLDLKDDVTVFCCRVQIIQILINLINNSIDAISQVTEKRWITIALGQDEAFADVTVTDSGYGIEPLVAERIMTPFFTTKASQKGTGIGLSLSRSIARHHGGDLVLDQKSERTRFRLTLPKGSQPNPEPRMEA